MSFPMDGADGIPARPHFPDIEAEVLRYWEENGIFHEVMQSRADSGEEFVFYDGPPFANGLPHYGHLLAGYAKDVVPRYRTMRGQHVKRRFGWTSHGLPAELDAEKKLGITTKSDIESIGVAEFNEVCRTTVMRYTQEWRNYVNRQARWVDFDDAVKTHDVNYMESVLWAFKSLWEKGLIYQGHAVSWYCTHCETPLAHTESTGRLDGTDTHRKVPGTLALVSVPLSDGTVLLLETETPWALPAATAVAVHPDAEYVVVAGAPDIPGLAGRRVVLAADRLAAYADLTEAPVVSTRRGADLAGLAYAPLFDGVHAAARGTRHVVLAERHVPCDTGTGVVAVTPCFNEQDHAVAEAAGIARLYPVDARGRYTEEAPVCAGTPVLESTGAVLEVLRESGRLLREDSHELPRPHCWRCETPLLEHAIPSWFVAVTRLRERMLELNEDIAWTPEHIRDGQFGNWLRNAKDWNVSRNRYWGAPIPVWMSDDPAYPRIDVYGSLDELERDFGIRPDDLHRPHIDALTRPNPDDPSGRSRMRRVPEVLDCWFETGSMPFAQLHYPFENVDWFDQNSPGDFVVEYYAQTRGWFYNMHVLSTALFDRPAFTHATVLGVVLGLDGQAMSKASGNYLDVNDVFAREGSDAMRWFLMSSPLLRGRDLEISDDGSREALRNVLLPLWNAWHFLDLHTASVAEPDDTRASHFLDRYLLARTRSLVSAVTEAMDTHNLSDACSLLREHLDALTNWYIRCSRTRFAHGDKGAVGTLRHVLEVLCRLLAPLLPLVTEYVWCALTGGRSVHLTDWPTPDELPDAPELVARIDRLRQITSAALSHRRSNGIRLRQPLARLVVATPDAPELSPFVSVLRDQVNVKDVVFTTDVAEHGQIRVTVNARAAGPRLGREVQEVIKAASRGEWTRTERGEMVIAGKRLEPGEYEERFVADGSGAVALPENSGLIVLDTRLDDELLAEGAVRDAARVVQQARQAADLLVGERIVLTIDASEKLTPRLRRHLALLAEETLAEEVVFGAVAEGGFVGSVGDGSTVRVQVSRT
ncbi:isoleucine--tRNA ligase [Streptomyces rishiriensis]|uniref:isoleucine--tRNA ligase n=1 Tax=Streptomyces rishiriensis TaxID=68264 RepID=UPI0037917C43